MTAEQKKWLDDHRAEGYRPLGTGGRWTKRGMLHADGTFEAIAGRGLPRVSPGCFEVGVLEPPVEPGGYLR